MNSNNLAFLAELEGVIEARRGADDNSSYTRELFTRGTPYIAQKVGEEAVELAIAAVQGDKQRTVSEAADLMYHLLVLLADSELSLSDVTQELTERQR